MYSIGIVYHLLSFFLLLRIFDRIALKFKTLLHVIGTKNVEEKHYIKSFSCPLTEKKQSSFM